MTARSPFRGLPDDDSPYQRRSGFEPLPATWRRKPCCHPSHQPPSMMVIPQGSCYRHVCPGCGAEVVLYPSDASLRCGPLAV